MPWSQHLPLQINVKPKRGLFFGLPNVDQPFFGLAAGEDYFCNRSDGAKDQMVLFRSVTSSGKGQATWSRCLAGFFGPGQFVALEAKARLAEGNERLQETGTHRSLCWGTGRDEWGASHSKGHGKEQSLGTGGRGPGRERKSSASQQRAPSVG